METATEELGHIGMLATAVSKNLQDASDEARGRVEALIEYVGPPSGGKNSIRIPGATSGTIRRRSAISGSSTVARTWASHRDGRCPDRSR